MHSLSMKNCKCLLLLCFFAISFVSKAQVYKPDHQPAPNSNEVKFPEASAFAKAKLSYKIIAAAANTFCYDIFSDGKLLIHQPSVPGMPGNKGFKDKASAERVAEVVMKKIKNGEMPPTITADDMKKANAVY